jgi:hypothetical protein
MAVGCARTVMAPTPMTRRCAAAKFEAKAIYVSQEDYESAITKNAVWIDVALSKAVFDKDNLGHSRLYSGTLKNVNGLERWRGRDQPHIVISNSNSRRV